MLPLAARLTKNIAAAATARAPRLWWTMAARPRAASATTTAAAAASAAAAATTPDYSHQMRVFTMGVLTAPSGDALARGVERFAAAASDFLSTAYECTGKQRVRLERLMATTLSKSMSYSGGSASVLRRAGDALGAVLADGSPQIARLRALYSEATVKKWQALLGELHDAAAVLPASPHVERASRSAASTPGAGAASSPHAARQRAPRSEPSTPALSAAPAPELAPLGRRLTSSAATARVGGEEAGGGGGGASIALDAALPPHVALVSAASPRTPTGSPAKSRAAATPTGASRGTGQQQRLADNSSLARMLLAGQMTDAALREIAAEPAVAARAPPAAAPPAVSTPAKAGRGAAAASAAAASAGRAESSRRLARVDAAASSGGATTVRAATPLAAGAKPATCVDEIAVATAALSPVPHTRPDRGALMMTMDDTTDLPGSLGARFAALSVSPADEAGVDGNDDDDAALREGDAEEVSAALLEPLALSRSVEQQLDAHVAAHFAATAPQPADVARKHAILTQLERVVVGDALGFYSHCCPDATHDAPPSRGAMAGVARPRLFMFGSSANGFGAAAADLDTMVHLPDVPAHDSLFARELLCDQQLPSEARRFLGRGTSERESMVFRKVLKELRQHPAAFTKIVPVPYARVPIIKLTHASPAAGASLVDVDLSFGNRLVVFNTRLLETYAQLAPAVRPLVFAVKAWAKARDVVGAVGSNLSSYALVLMVLHFLQARARLLPALQHPGMMRDWSAHVRCGGGGGGAAALAAAVVATSPSLLDEPIIVDGADVRFVPDAAFARAWWDAHGGGGAPAAAALSPGALFAGFVDYYAAGFPWETGVVSVRTGGDPIPPRSVFLAHGGKQPPPWRLAIEDPFERSHDLGRVLTERRQMSLWAELQRARELLQRASAAPLSPVPAPSSPRAGSRGAAVEAPPLTALASLWQPGQVAVVVPSKRRRKQNRAAAALGGVGAGGGANNTSIVSAASSGSAGGGQRHSGVFGGFLEMRAAHLSTLAAGGRLELLEEPRVTAAPPRAAPAAPALTRAVGPAAAVRACDFPDGLLAPPGRRRGVSAGTGQTPSAGAAAAPVPPAGSPPLPPAVSTTAPPRAPPRAYSAAAAAAPAASAQSSRRSSVASAAWSTGGTPAAVRSAAGHGGGAAASAAPPLGGSSGGAPRPRGAAALQPPRLQGAPQQPLPQRELPSRLAARPAAPSTGAARLPRAPAPGASSSSSSSSSSRGASGARIHAQAL